METEDLKENPQVRMFAAMPDKILNDYRRKNNRLMVAAVSTCREILAIESK